MFDGVRPAARSTQAMGASASSLLEQDPLCREGANESCYSIRRKGDASQALYAGTAETFDAGRIEACIGTPTEMVEAEWYARGLHHHRVSWASYPQRLRRRPTMGSKNQVHRGISTSRNFGRPKSFA